MYGVYICMYVCMYVCMRVHMYIYMCVSMYACIYVCMYACIYVCMYVLYMYVCAYSNAVCQEVFDLTASPQLTEGRVCREDITFTCTIQNVPEIGTAVRWYVNNNTTYQYIYIYLTSDTYPVYVVNGSIQLKVDQASLNSARDAINAVMRFVASYQVLQDMGIRQLRCGKSFDVSRSISITGVDDTIGKGYHVH